MSKPIKDIQLYNDLSAVEELLLADGWTQGTEFDPVTGSRCLLGAVTHVLYKQESPERYSAVCETLGPAAAVAAFNDAPTTTLEDVLARLRAARDAL